MAEAILSALRNKGVQNMEQVTVFDVHESRLGKSRWLKLKQRFLTVYEVTAHRTKILSIIFSRPSHKSQHAPNVESVIIGGMAQ